MTPAKDRNGNFHDSETGQFVSMKEFVLRIFEEKEAAADYKSMTLERALVEAKVTTERAILKAANTVQTRLLEAKAAADERDAAMMGRLDQLESGGAPFANRLDLSLTTLRGDVDTLKTNMVRTTVLDALREQTDLETRATKKQIKYIFVAAGVSLLLNFAQLTVRAMP